MTTPEFDDAFRAHFEDLLRWRRDVRRFRDTAVEPELLEHLLSLADLAPSVGLSQPWRFAPVEGKTARNKIIASFERCNAEALQNYEGYDRALYAQLKLEGLKEAPVQYAVFCDQETAQGKGLGQKTMPETLRYSVVNAIYTFWLAARAYGLGVGWVSIVEPDAVREAVDAPPHWTLVAYLCVGYPSEQHTDPELERAGWETRR